MWQSESVPRIGRVVILTRSPAVSVARRSCMPPSNVKLIGAASVRTIVSTSRPAGFLDEAFQSRALLGVGALVNDQYGLGRVGAVERIAERRVGVHDRDHAQAVERHVVDAPWSIFQAITARLPRNPSSEFA